MYQSIIVATDLSPTSSAAVRAGADLAKALGARLFLLHVYDLPVVPFLDAAIVPPPSYLADVVRESDRRLTELRDQLRGEGIQVDSHTRTGPHVEEIVKGIKELKGDLLVIATHGRTGVRRLFMGSVAERLVRVSPIPVLVVHTLPQKSSEEVTEGE